MIAAAIPKRNEESTPWSHLRVFGSLLPPFLFSIHDGTNRQSRRVQSFLDRKTCAHLPTVGVQYTVVVVPSSPPEDEDDFHAGVPTIMLLGQSLETLSSQLSHAPLEQLVMLAGKETAPPGISSSPPSSPTTVCLFFLNREIVLRDGGIYAQQNNYTPTYCDNVPYPRAVQEFAADEHRGDHKGFCHSWTHTRCSMFFVSVVLRYLCC
jgi:hypothetical protein